MEITSGSIPRLRAARQHSHMWVAIAPLWVGVNVSAELLMKTAFIGSISLPFAARLL
jgi:hypothetical protein